MLDKWLHQIKKDLRYIKYAAVSWALFIVLFFVIKTQLLSADISSGTITIFTVYMFMYVIKNILVVFLVPLMVQTDPVVGSTASWLTRPISGGMLFCSKITVVLSLLLVLPLIGEFTRLSVNGMSTGIALKALLEYAIGELALIFPLILFAVITANLLKYILASALPLFLTLMVVLNPSLNETLLAASSNLQLFSKMLMLKIFLVLVAGAAVFYQYVSRDTQKTVVLSVFGLLGLLVILHTWDLDFTRNPVPVLSPGHPVRKALIQAKYPTMERSSFSGFDDEGDISYSGTVSYYMIPEKYRLHLDYFSGIRLKTKKGNTVDLPERETKEPRTSVITFRERFEPLSFMLEGAAILSPEISRYSDSRGYAFATPLKISGRLEDTIKEQGPFRYSTSMHLSLFEFSPVAVLPLEVGASAEMGEDGIRVSDLQPGAGEYYVKLKMKFLNLLMSGSLKKKYLLDMDGRDISKFKRGFLLHNPVEKQALLPKEQTFPYVAVYPFEVRYGEIHFHVPLDLPEQWFRDARLVVYKAQKTGRFSESLVIDKIHIKHTDSRGGHSGRRRSRKHLVSALKKRRLSPKAPQWKVRDYIAGILIIDNFDYDEKDPRIEKLADIGHRHLGTLAEMGDRFTSESTYCAFQAIDRLAEPGDKELIVSLLEKYPRLIKTVRRFNWLPEAKEVILRRLRQNPYKFSLEWLKAALTYADPLSYPDLERLFIKLEPDYLVRTYTDVQALPGFDLPKVVAAAWKHFRYGRSDTVYRLLPAALVYGDVNALAVAVRLLDAHDLDENERTELWKTLLRFTDYTGKREHMRAWLEKNKKNLHYDKKRKIYMVHTGAKLETEK
ncbi:MAG: hypothetical protein GY765_14920 [bacterium]|nr:hypothetical protein [bacterium]